MKKIEELTEQEILNLTEDEISRMIKFRMAEEGVRFIARPEMPEFPNIQKPTTKAYYCALLGRKLSFTDMNELTSVLELLSSCKSACSIDENYELPDGFRNYIKEKKENAEWSSAIPDAITPISVYTYQEFRGLKEELGAYSKAKKDFDAATKEYEAAKEKNKWIRDEIVDKVNEVKSKYSKLENYVYRFKTEYLPLAENNEEVAMNFLDKAYYLTDEQKEYVLSNTM